MEKKLCMGFIFFFFASKQVSLNSIFPWTFWSTHIYVTLTISSNSWPFLIPATLVFCQKPVNEKLCFHLCLLVTIQVVLAARVVFQHKSHRMPPWKTKSLSSPAYPGSSHLPCCLRTLQDFLLFLEPQGLWPPPLSTGILGLEGSILSYPPITSWLIPHCLVSLFMFGNNSSPVKREWCRICEGTSKKFVVGWYGKTVYIFPWTFWNTLLLWWVLDQELIEQDSDMHTEETQVEVEECHSVAVGLHWEFFELCSTLARLSFFLYWKALISMCSSAFITPQAQS